MTLVKRVCQALTCVCRRIEQRNLCLVLVDGQRKHVTPILTLPDGLEEPAHEHARQDECRGHARLSDVRLDLRFAIKVRNVRQFALAGFGGVDQGREDQVFDTGRFAGIGDRLSLRDFGLGGHSLPEVRHQEYGVRILHGRGSGVYGRHVGLDGTVQSAGCERCRTDMQSSYLHDLDALRSEVFDRVLGFIASDGSNAELLGQFRMGQDSSNDRAPLVAGGAEDRQ